MKIGDSMVCNKCGAALPSDGAVCLQCGAMMSKEQIEEKRKWKEINKQNNNIKLMSSKYGVNKENFSYNNEPKKENKLLGLLVIVGVLLLIILFAAIKFFG